MRGSIESTRLSLIPLRPAFLRASLDAHSQRAEELLGATLPEFWPDPLRRVLALRLEQLESDPSLQPWLLRAVVLRRTKVMAGCIGFHSAPGPEYLEDLSPGGVEFGFTVFPEFRRQGYAREASLALMQWARQGHGVSRFILCISRDNEASVVLADQLGFIRVGQHVDEVDGLEEVWEFIDPDC